MGPLLPSLSYRPQGPERLRPDHRHRGQTPNRDRRDHRRSGQRWRRDLVPFRPTPSQDPTELIMVAPLLPPDLQWRAQRQTDSATGEDPAQRTLERALRLGIILLDKPRGPTSHQVAAWVK